MSSILSLKVDYFDYCVFPQNNLVQKHWRKMSELKPLSAKKQETPPHFWSDNGLERVPCCESGMQLKLSFTFLSRNWVLATNSDFLIPISLNPNIVNLRYFNIRVLLDQIKYQRFTPSGCYGDYKIWVCGKFRIWSIETPPPGNNLSPVITYSPAANFDSERIWKLLICSISFSMKVNCLILSQFWRIKQQQQTVQVQINFNT